MSNLLIKSGEVKYNPTDINYAFNIGKENTTSLNSTLLDRTIEIGTQAIVDIQRIGKLSINNYKLIDNTEHISFENEVIVDTLLTHLGFGGKAELLAKRIVSLFCQSVYAPLLESVIEHPAILGKKSPSAVKMATVIEIDENKVRVIREMIMEIRSLADPENKKLVTYIKSKVTVEGGEDDFINQRMNRLKVSALQTAETSSLAEVTRATYTTNHWFKSIDTKTYI